MCERSCPFFNNDHTCGALSDLAELLRLQCGDITDDRNVHRLIGGQVVYCVVEGDVQKCDYAKTAVVE